MENGSHNKDAVRLQPGEGISRFLPLLICIVLAVAVFSVYLQTLGHDFLNYDDDVYVTNNPNVLGGISGKGAVWAFATNHSANWHPVTWFSHMLDIQIYGLNPACHHLTNVLIHVANALLLFMVLMRMTGKLWRTDTHIFRL